MYCTALLSKFPRSEGRTVCRGNVRMIGRDRPGVCASVGHGSSEEQLPLATVQLKRAASIVEYEHLLDVSWAACCSVVPHTLYLLLKPQVKRDRTEIALAASSRVGRALGRAQVITMRRGDASERGGEQGVGAEVVCEGCSGHRARAARLSRPVASRALPGSAGLWP